MPSIAVVPGIGIGAILVMVSVVIAADGGHECAGMIRRGGPRRADGKLEGLMLVAAAEVNGDGRAGGTADGDVAERNREGAWRRYHRFAVLSVI